MGVDTTSPVGSTTTRDGFFKGKFEIYQPQSGGHRAGLDAILLSATVPTGFSGLIADFGAGAGAAGIAIASRISMAKVDLVERDMELAALASRSLGLPANIRLRGRVAVIQTDVTLSGTQREEAGLNSAKYDMVIINPPFNDPTHRPSPKPARQEAHVMGEGGLDPWLRSAAAVTKGRGQVALIHRPTALGQILAAFQGRFGATRIIPVHPKKDEAANRILVLAIRGAKAPASILPGFVVHEDDGSYTRHAAAILAGETVLPHIK